MEEERENQICSNCKKEFPSDRIDLHEAYCCRNIRKCQKCDKMIDLKDQQQHDKQFHDKVECQLCKQMIEPNILPQHPSQCPRRPMNCKFCQNNWPFCEFDKHILTCGARTKPCTICHKNIMYKDFQEHSARCERRREERAEVSQDQMRERGHRNNPRNNGQRQRQNSINNPREHVKPTSLNKIMKPNSYKPSNIVGPEVFKSAIDPIPISVRLTINAAKNKEQQQPRIPLKSKN